MMKDLFGKTIEAGDTIIRPVFSELEIVKVIRTIDSSGTLVLQRQDKYSVTLPREVWDQKDIPTKGSYVSWFIQQKYTKRFGDLTLEHQELIKPLYWRATPVYHKKEHYNIIKC